MPDYPETLREVFYEEDRVLTRPEVFSLVRAMYPRHEWVKATVDSWLGGLTVNDGARCSRRWASQRAFLFNLGRGRRRVYDPLRDGFWVVVRDGKECEVTEISTARLEHVEAGLRPLRRDSLVDQIELRKPDFLATDQHGRYVVVGVEGGKATVKTLKRVLKNVRGLTRHLTGGTSVRGMILAHQFEKLLQHFAVDLPNGKFVKYDRHGFGAPWD